MKRYCFDTSGFSNPLETMPEEIHAWLWLDVRARIEAGEIAVTTEIYEEMTHIPGEVGACIQVNRDSLVLEVGDDGWNWVAYKNQATTLQLTHQNFISEYNGGSPKMVSLNDISIVALAKALELPLVSMEVMVRDPNARKRKIPNICQDEMVEHLTFNDYLRREGITR